MNKTQIQYLVVSATKAGDAVLKNAFKSVLAGIQEAEGRGQDVDECKILKIIELESKKYTEQASFLKEGEKDNAEKAADALKKLLPVKVAESEYPRIVNDAILYFEGENGNQPNIGGIIKLLKADYGNTLDYGKISKLIQVALTNLRG